MGLGQSIQKSRRDCTSVTYINKQIHTKLMSSINKLFFGLLLLVISLVSSYAQTANNEIYKSNTLIIKQISQHTFVHITYLQTQSFGKVACNGMIVTDKGEALVFDTPADDSASYELIGVIEKQLHSKVKGIVVNHFHDDCVGGLVAFHAKGIPSYANEKTILFAKENQHNVPQHGFEGSLTLKVGRLDVVNKFIGEAHTRDNIVSYVPKEKVMFGGCMIKEVNATKGYLGDANTAVWSATIANVQKIFPKTKWVIPGHGQYGGQELFSYTMKLFEAK